MAASTRSGATPSAAASLATVVLNGRLPTPLRSDRMALEVTPARAANASQDSLGATASSRASRVSVWRRAEVTARRVAKTSEVFYMCRLTLFRSLPKIPEQ